MEALAYTCAMDLVGDPVKALSLARDLLKDVRKSGLKSPFADALLRRLALTRWTKMDRPRPTRLELKECKESHILALKTTMPARRAARLELQHLQEPGARARVGEPMWKPGWSAGPAHAGFWYRYKVPQRDTTGHFDPLALPPIADTMPPALARKLGPQRERILMPSLDLTVYFLAPTRGEWILVESFAERARAGFAVASANLWDERGELVARATQTMTLRTR